MGEPWQEQPESPHEAEKLRTVKKVFGIRDPEEEMQLQESCKTAIAEGELAWGAVAPFDRGRACPKCGATGARTKHIDPTELELGQLPVRFYKLCGMHEALCRHCNDCHYEWFEKPLDAP